MTIPVICVSDRKPTEPYYIYDAFHESLRRFGHEAVVLGFGEPYRGMMSRLKLPLQYLRTIQDEHVILTDCWDVLFLASPVEIVNYLRCFTAPIVISAERTLFPDKDYGEYPESFTSDVKYLNAGFIVAERKELISLLEHLDVDNQPDDFKNPDDSWTHFSEQELLHHAYVEQFVPIELDKHNLLCQNMFKTLPGEVVIEEGRIYNTISKIHPSVIHWNGPAKTEAELLPAYVIDWWRNR